MLLYVCVPLILHKYMTVQLLGRAETAPWLCQMCYTYLTYSLGGISVSQNHFLIRDHEKYQCFSMNGNAVQTWGDAFRISFRQAWPEFDPNAWIFQYSLSVIAPPRYVQWCSTWMITSFCYLFFVRSFLFVFSVLYCIVLMQVFMYIGEPPLH